MNIRDTIVYLEELFTNMAISEPYATVIKRVYTFPPPPTTSLEAPCIMVLPELMSVDFQSVFFSRNYDLHIQVFVGEAQPEQHIRSEQATQFIELIARELYTHQRLGNTVSLVSGMRGETDTLTRLTWNNKSYVGADLVISVRLQDSESAAA